MDQPQEHRPSTPPCDLLPPMNHLLILITADDDLAKDLTGSLTYSGLGVTAVCRDEEDPKADELLDYMFNFVRNLVRNDADIKHVHILRIKPCEFDSVTLQTKIGKLGVGVTSITAETEGGIRAYLEDCVGLTKDDVPTEVNEVSLDPLDELINEGPIEQVVVDQPAPDPGPRPKKFADRVVDQIEPPDYNDPAELRQKIDYLADKNKDLEDRVIMAYDQKREIAVQLIHLKDELNALKRQNTALFNAQGDLVRTVCKLATRDH